MGISVIGAAASSGGGGGTNNFVLKTTAETTYVLDRTYTSGRYSLSFLDSDTTFDIYAIAEDGTYAGYTASTTLEVSADFAEVVVLGAASGTRISFTHLGVLTEAVTSGDVATAGAFISSVVTSSLPSVDDTTVVNGGNFAANVAVSFIDQSSVETSAKTVVRSSSAQLLVTRPDAFSPDDSPYTVKVVNPGIPVPAGTNAHLLSNSVTAGTNPVWTTSTVVPYNVGGATSVTLLATDTEASDIDYSVVSGTLPAGLTLDGETGVISGTFSGSASEGDVTSVTIRAIDTGGNFLDKAFNFTANVAPTWTTAAGAIEEPKPDTAYTFALVASTGSAGGALTYTLQSGALLAGHSLSTVGVISGTSTGVTDDTATFTVRVTDEGGLFADRSFTTTIGAAGLAPFFLTASSLDAESDMLIRSTITSPSTQQSASLWQTVDPQGSRGGIVQIRNNAGVETGKHSFFMNYTGSGTDTTFMDMTDAEDGSFTVVGKAQPGGNSPWTGDIHYATNVKGDGGATSASMSRFSTAGTIGTGENFEPYQIHTIYHNGVKKFMSTGDYTFGQRACFVHVVNAAGNTAQASRVWRINTPNNAYSGQKGSAWSQALEKLYVVSNGWNGERTLLRFDPACNIEVLQSYGTSQDVNGLCIDGSDGSLFLYGQDGKLLKTNPEGAAIHAKIITTNGGNRAINAARVIGNTLFLMQNDGTDGYITALDKTTYAVLWSKKFAGGPVADVARIMGNDAGSVTIKLKISSVSPAELLVPITGLGLAASYTGLGNTVSISSVTTTVSATSATTSSTDSFIDNIHNAAGMSSANSLVSTSTSPNLTYSYTAI